MTELRTEEEQIAAIKSWWKENGKSIVIAVVVALAAVYGWKAWQQKQLDQKEAASVMYQQLLDAAIPAVTSKVDEDIATTKHLASQLKAEYGDTEYAQFAALLMAKVAFVTGDYDLAQQQLDWVLTTDANALLKSVTNLRKAQLLQQKGELDAAITLVQAVSDASLQAQSQELLGDLYIAKGDRAAARDAYQAALDNQESGASSVLSMKLNDLAVEGS